MSNNSELTRMSALPRTRKLCKWLVLLVSVGAFSLPGSLSASAGVDNHGVQGIVTDNSGAGIYNVQVAICHPSYDPQCTTPDVTRTNTAGSYYVGCCGDGETVLVWANKDLALAYWAEKQNATIPPGINTRARADFKLPGDLFYPTATILMMFGTASRSHTSWDLSWTMSATVSTKVDAYNVPFGRTVEVQYGLTVGGNSHNTASQVRKRGVVVHGEFWKSDPSHPSVYVSAIQNVWSTTNDQADYMNPPGGDPCCREIVYPGGSISYTYKDSASYYVRYEFGVDVSVTIEVISFSTKLASLLVEGGVNVERTMTVSVTNNDTVPHTYLFYLEGGEIFHMWEIG